MIGTYGKCGPIFSFQSRRTLKRRVEDQLSAIIDELEAGTSRDQNEDLNIGLPTETPEFVDFGDSDSIVSEIHDRNRTKEYRGKFLRLIRNID